MGNKGWQVYFLWLSKKVVKSRKDIHAVHSVYKFMRMPGLTSAQTEKDLAELYNINNQTARTYSRNLTQDY